jgi:hypothetical protein
MELIYKKSGNSYAYYNLNETMKVCETQREATKFLLKQEKDKKKVSNSKDLDITYLVCIHCGELTTDKEQLKLIETLGSQGMCYCKYGNDKYDNGRIFYPYYKITKPIYKAFKKLTKKERLIFLCSLELKEW